MRAILSLFVLFNISVSYSQSFNEKFFSFYEDGFTDDEIVEIFEDLKSFSPLNNQAIRVLYIAAKNPYAPSNSHAGDKFYQALSWYNDITTGNRDGRFTLKELKAVFDKEVTKYLKILVNEGNVSDRVSSWKMLQKLTLLKNEILSSGNTFFHYNSKSLGQVNYNNDWNKKYTISSLEDFRLRVLEGSYERPVLIKFGLTYCVHCLLMENLGSVPAVAKKYEGKITVYKLWWNPKDRNYVELNSIAAQEGITSSPMFNLYIGGRLVKSEYAFPDENGDGLEEFLYDYL